MTTKVMPLFSVLLLLLASHFAQAQTSQFLEYEYDAAGNIIRMTRSIADAAPEVTALTPSLIHINQVLNITASGASLLDASVTTDHPELTVSNISSTPSRVNFTLTSSATTPLGLHTLTFTTGLGSTTASIEVIPDQPDLFVFPAPVAVANTGLPVTLIVELQTPDVIDHVINLSAGNPGIAQVSPTTVTLAAGQQRPSEIIQVTGLINGSTTLTLQSPLLDTYRTMVFVAPPLVPTAGDYGATARPLGIRRGEPVQPTATLSPLLSPLVGIVRQSTTGTTAIAPILAPLVGVSRPANPLNNISVGPLLAPLLGVQRDSGTASGSAVSPLVTPLLGVERNTP